MTDIQTDRFIKIRRHLHQHPELSGREVKTSEFVINYLNECNPDKVITGIGGHGILAFFGDASLQSEPKIMIRCELDALPIKEETEQDHRSKNEGVMHACGHDGHLTIVLGVADWLKKNRPETGAVLLLFQPAEETGEGAPAVLNDPQFKDIKPDHAYALHNIPGTEAGTVLIREGTFACASTGLKLFFKGKSSHAGYPGQGINPSWTVAEIVNFVNSLDMVQDISSPDFAIATNTYIKVGEVAFGTNPGFGEMGITFRSANDEQLNLLKNRVIDKCRDLNKVKGNPEITWKTVEPFPAAINNKKGVEIVKRASENAGVKVQEMKHPFPWSEDFGNFRNRCPITLFGLGSGKDMPPLHAERYDFNDTIIPVGVNVFINIIKETWNQFC